MRILTVRQPWAWAIIHGGKNVENRTRNVAGDYRGPVAIHAAARDASPYTPAMYAVADLSGALVLEAPRSVILGVVDLTEVHSSAIDDRGRTICWPDTRFWAFECSRWAQPNHHHLELANPRALATPIPAKGRLGLWRPDPELEAAINAELEAIA